MPLAFIDDGCTERAFLRAEYNLYDEIRVEFRPFTAPEKHTIMQRLRGVVQNGENYIGLTATEIAKRISLWNIEDGNGGIYRITATNVARLKPELLGRLFSLLLGEHGGDKDPDDSPEKWASGVMGGHGVERIEEAREKNSEAA